MLEGATTAPAVASTWECARQLKSAERVREKKGNLIQNTCT